MRSMKVILLENVRRLGALGETVTVAPGFFRNWLFPQGVAVPFNRENQQYFEEKKAELEAEALKKLATAQEKAALIEGTEVVVRARAAEEGKLYGSVSALEIAQALNAVLTEGLSVQRAEVSLSKPFREIGSYTVQIQLHPEVSANISLQIQAA